MSPKFKTCNYIFAFVYVILVSKDGVLKNVCGVQKTQFKRFSKESKEELVKII